MTRSRGIGFVLSVLLVAAALAGPALADPPYPRYGTRIVDGDISDWDLTVDFYDYMYRAGNPGHPVESWLYLRHDCPTNTVYVLVRNVPGVFSLTNPPSLQWVAINSQSNKVVDGYSGNDGTPPDFAWVDLAPAPGDSIAGGWEASFPLLTGNYFLIVHGRVIDENTGQTSATTGFPQTGIQMTLECSVPVQQTTWGRIKSLYGWQ